VEEYKTIRIDIGRVAREVKDRWKKNCTCNKYPESTLEADIREEKTNPSRQVTAKIFKQPV